MTYSRISKRVYAKNKSEDLALAVRDIYYNSENASNYINVLDQNLNMIKEVLEKGTKEYRLVLVMYANVNAIKNNIDAFMRDRKTLKNIYK